MSADDRLPLLEKPVLTIEEACLISTLSESTIYRAIAAKQLNTRKHGRRTVVLRSDLDAWIGTFQAQAGS